MEGLILLTLANVALGAWIVSRLARNRVKRVFFAWASEFKNSLLEEIIEDPEIIMKILGPALKKLAKQYGVPEPGEKGGSINLFGFKIPRELLHWGLPILGKKLGKEAEALNPFG